MMPARTYPGSLVAVLAVLACSGWVVAWRSSHQDGAEAKAPAKEEKNNSRTRPRSAGRDTSGAAFVADPATARLLATYDELVSRTSNGEPNKKLVEACRDALKDNDNDRRARNFGLLLELARPEDAPAIHKMFAELDEEGRAFSEYTNFAKRWGMVDPVGAMDFLKTQHKNGVIPRNDLRSLAFGWGKVDPGAALKWMDENSAEADRSGGRVGVVDGWLKTDPGGASKWIAANEAKLGPDGYAECVGYAFSAHIFSGSTELAGGASWLAALPDDEVSNAAAAYSWQRMQWALKQLPYERAAEVWSKVGNEPWMDFEQFENFSKSTANATLAQRGLDGYLEALGKSWPEDKVTSQFERWSTESPDETMAWLEKAPSTPVTKAAIRGLIKTLEQTDPGSAATWSAKLAE